MKISLTDNSIGTVFLRNDVATLFPIAGKSVEQLCRENENLLIFPHSISESGDRIGDATVLDVINTEDPESVRLVTGNVMGFIGVGDLKLKIQSRFDGGRDDYLLHYMLQKVLSFNLFDLSHNNAQEDMFEFIMFMFPYFLKTAMRQGVYREYRNFHHNDSNLKGVINIGRHIAKNVPFIGNVAYSTRRYSHDNKMTQLIHHTIEFMRTRKYGQAILGIDKETAENVKTIVEYTPSYNKNERRAVISNNLRRSAHPYYTHYRPLQTLCLQILRMEELKYGETDDEISGILFDGAWLWEEYLNTILRNHGFKHPQNKQGKGGFYLFDDNTGPRFPDFYKDDIVLDAKYKRLDKLDRVANVGRDDIHQIIAYLWRLKASRGGFVVPLEKSQESVPTSRLNGYDATVSIFGVEISKNAASYSQFCAEMHENEEKFIKSISF